MAKYGWLFDVKRCIECRACESACKQWNGVETGVNIRYRQVHTSESGKYPNVTTQALSLACNHCEDAWCMKACPVKAYFRRDDGIVLIDWDRCVGCTMCSLLCPYGAPQFNWAKRKMEKCTMCADRVDANLAPACATLCPTEALQWGLWDNIKGKGVPQVSGFANPNQTKPNIRFVTAGWAKK
jgi:DMSO reductase iron-sulfur subunit